MTTLELGRKGTPQPRPLALCLALALGTAGALGVAQTAQAAVLAVSNCNDSGSGSLREAVAAAADGDTVDLSTLMCGTITLTSGAITVAQSSLSLTGPGADELAIDGDLNDRVFRHTGTNGTLSISALTVSHGRYVSNADPHGGCIVSAGNVALLGTTVSECVLVGQENALARGGAVLADGNLSMLSSTLSGSVVSGSATGSISNAEGGGAVMFGNFTCKYSTISDNTAIAQEGHNSSGGGVQAFGGVTIIGSTFSGNYASGFGAIIIQGSTGSALISNSTISNNSANSFSAVYTQLPLKLSNSTIAFNRARFGRGALYSQTAPLELQSSIIAGNEETGSAQPDDVNGTGATVVTGANNLITSSTIALPADTITDCPQLAPLASNGGTTRTHALRDTSPAIDVGNNVDGLTNDQRGSPRVSGAAADIGAYEWQGAVDEFLFSSGFEPVCDQ